jgi:translocation and assembly module TamB
MRILTSLFAVFIWIFSLSAAVAQDEDKGFLTRSIQDALSGAGRTVSIDGFQGALSSSASFDRMTIADKDGIWLTLEDVTLVWTRSALLRGRLEVDQLTAAKLDIPRLPLPDENALPQAEATPFSLPDLPVSVDIAAFSVDQINLGAPLLGEAAQLAVTASARLNDAGADVDFTARRSDGKQGEFALRASLNRSDNILDLLLKLTEGPEGITARLLNIPDQPSVDLSVQGTGPLSDFKSDVRVATDGQERLAGQITLGSETPRRSTDHPDRRIQADIGGDITALLAPRYRAFFGTDVKLTLDALQQADGAVEVSAFSLAAQSADLSGKITLNKDKWPTLIDISGSIANPDGSAILLPTGGQATTVGAVTLKVAYDAAQADAITADFNVTALASAAATIDTTRLTLNGTLQSDQGALRAFEGDLALAAQGLLLSDPASAKALGDQIKTTAHLSYAQEQPTRISDLILTGTEYDLAGTATLSGLEAGFKTRLDLALNAADLSRFSALAGQELHGKSRLAVTGTVTPLGGLFDLDIQGQTQDLRLGIAQADALLAGRTDLKVTAKRNETGTFLRDLTLKNAALEVAGNAELRSGDSRATLRATLADIALVVPEYHGPLHTELTAVQSGEGWALDATADGPYALSAKVNGKAAPVVDLNFDLALPEIGAVVPDVSGPLRAQGNLRQTDKGFVIQTSASGPYGAKALVSGLVTGPDMALDFDLSVPDVQPLVPNVRGPLSAKGTLSQKENGFFITTSASGPYGAKALVSGLVTGPDMALDFDVSVPDVQPLVPGVSGPLAAKGVLRQTPDGLAVNTNATGPYATRASVQGVVTGPRAAVDFTLAMPNIGAVLDRVNGPLDLTGTARKQGNGWQVDTSATGPAGTQARFAGVFTQDGKINATLNGTAPLGLSRPFISPRNLQGLARFDLALNGAPALSSLSGTIQTSDAALSAPNLRIALKDIAASIRLGNNRADIDIQGQEVNGGRLRVAGNVVLTPALPADLQIALQDLVLIDPKLYRTTLRGDLRLAGPLTGGAQISGQIDVGETDVSVPSTGMTSIGDIPLITHIGGGAQVAATRNKAGIADANSAGDVNTTASGPGFGLNLQINAPRRIFVRGRGLDAELGGGLSLTGSTNRIISTGAFDLIRGRLDILGKRFNLVEGSITFLGDLIPYIRFVSSTDTKAGTARVIVDGPANDPQVSFEATPDAPQDEVLAQLLFDRNIADISAFQALQLASAVATLAGRGGGGVISKLRDGFGLDDFDVTTTSSGATAVRAGKYISENIYTDVTAASDGTADVSLNLDLTPNLKAKGSVGSDGNGGLGLFFEKDY